MRSRLAIKTAYSGVFLQIIKIILNFVIRSAFIATLGTAILGVNSLFGNIMTILSISELGLGGAIVAHLYQPIARSDVERVQVLMIIYKKLYTFIGCFILIIGLVLSLFVPFLVGDYKGDLNLRIIFLLFVINSAGSYLTSFKTSILSASQRGYVLNRVFNIGFILQSIGQLVSLYIFKNYWMFLIIGIVVMILQNVFLSLISQRLYPQMFSNTRKVTADDFKSILDYAKPMMLYMISGVANTGTDNLIISKFLGINIVGIYSNYTIITTAIQSIIQTIFSSVTASVGNARYDKNVDFEVLFRRLNFAALWINTYLAAGVYLFINGFILSWLGKGMTFDTLTVLVISVNLFLMGISQPLVVFREATGSFTINQYKPVIATIINIVLSLVLVHMLGIKGVLLGTIVSRLSTYFWNDPLVLYKYFFKKSMLGYFSDVGKFVLFGIIFSFVWQNLVFTMGLNIINFYNFIFHGVLFTLVFNGLGIILFINDNSFKYFVKRFWKVGNK